MVCHFLLINLIYELDKFLAHGELYTAGCQLICGQFISKSFDEAVAYDFLINTSRILLLLFLVFHFIQETNYIIVFSLHFIIFGWDTEIDFNISTLELLSFLVIAIKLMTADCTVCSSKSIETLIFFIVNAIILNVSDKFVFCFD